MKYLAWCALVLAWTFSAQAQPLNFATTEYYTAQGKKLTASGGNLSAFNFSDAGTANHPLRADGIYYPIIDFQNKNLWVRVRYLGADPNGATVGWKVSSTNNSPFRSGGFGGWWGFLYRFDIYQDSVSAGPFSYTLADLTTNNILVESIETLSAEEWLSFWILNPASSGWFLQTKNLGNAPGSNPGFSDSVNYYPTTNRNALYTPDFPNSSDTIYAIDLGGTNYAEFRIGANDVSSFLYGYEYSNSGGYQGMTLTFGQKASVAVKARSNPLVAHPNPTKGLVYLDKLTQGKLVNAQGQEVLRVHGKSVNLEPLPAGLYLLQAEGLAPVRILKQ
jgi:hypothetical protein